MNITEVRVKLMHSRSDRLRAFCSITIDNDFVVHDLRVIEGRKGYFLAMPSRKLGDGCPQCGTKNPLKAKFCNGCGGRLEEDRGRKGQHTAGKLHVDVAHPINTPCREMLQSTVLTAYKEEVRRAEEGLAPSHEYTPEGIEDLAGEYVQSEDDEAETDALQAEPPAEEGLAPSHDYTPEGIEDLAGEYVETEDDEAATPGPQAQPPAEEGLAPSHDYAPEGVEDLAGEYVETTDDEAEPPGPQAEPPAEEVHDEPPQDTRPQAGPETAAQEMAPPEGPKRRRSRRPDKNARRAEAGPESAAEEMAPPEGPDRNRSERPAPSETEPDRPAQPTEAAQEDEEKAKGGFADGIF